MLGASLGVAVYPDHGTEAAELWRSADAAMYQGQNEPEATGMNS